jgi:hypothetical protein
VIDLEYGTYNGIMSGRPKSSTRTLVEHATAVDVSSVRNVADYARALVDGAVVLLTQWPSGESAQTTVKLVQTMPSFGGSRPWFECPECGRRCKKLYILETRPAFGCRACHNLIYRLQSDKALATAYWHWAFHHLGRRRGIKRVARFFELWQGCRNRGEKFDWGRRS